ncbi:MAG: hypothetical protein JSW27_00110, partial [Phycisphaerales bacterium]
RGIPVSSFVLERAGEPNYLSRFGVIVLSYENFKPAEAKMHTALVDWVRAGGVLVLLGQDGDALDAWPDSWWRRRGTDTALRALLDELGDTPAEDGTFPVGDGWVLRNSTSPMRFAQPEAAEETYLPLVRLALQKAGQEKPVESGAFCLQRGPFIIAHAETESLRLRGPLIDLFDPNLNLREAVALKPGSSGLYRDVAPMMQGDKPALLHATHRIVSSECCDGVLRFTLRGPAETPAVARVFLPATGSIQVMATNAQGEAVDVTCDRAGDAALLKFPNDPEGVTVAIR